MNPNLDPVEDIKRLGGERAELVMEIVDVLKPLVETGSPDMEDVAEMVEGLFEVCSGGEAKHNSRIVEMMAVKGLALAGVKKGHAIEKAVRQAVKKIGSPASKFGSFGDFYDAIVPVIHGDVSEEEMMTLFESLGIDKLTVAQALLPALFRKSLALAGIAAGTIATTGERFDKAVGSWADAKADGLYRRRQGRDRRLLGRRHHSRRPRGPACAGWYHESGGGLHGSGTHAAAGAGDGAAWAGVQGDGRACNEQGQARSGGYRCN